MTPVSLLLALVLTTTELFKGLRGQCIFPEFLRRPLPDGSDRTWTTETKFMENSNLWDTQLEVRVSEYNIIAKHKYKAQCHQHTTTVPCFQRQLSYRRVCMAREEGNKFRVQHHDNGRTTYLCMKFVQRNKNIVQVWTSSQKDENHNEICSEHLMKREEWPWLAPALEEWSFSPVVGGFDFTTHMYERRKQLCHMMWRPSRMETECVRGEGIVFSFPDQKCSPFVNHREVVKLQVWGSWVEDDYLYIVAAEFSQMPQFVLRFPRDLEMAVMISVDFYFSPVCPNDRGMSRNAPAVRTDVRHVELQMRRGEPGICYDESDRCAKYAQEGKCTNTALHEYANYCKRSCGLCNLLPSMRPECRFPSNIAKDWFLFETDRDERVRIHGGHLGFSTLGEFICKSKHWSINHYKMLSYYSNGCRPRYTCVHFSPDTDGTTLQFQISKSDTVDRSFRLCDFEDDPQPLGGLIRSSNYKTLIAASKTTQNSCGLRGVIKVNATLPGGERCIGTLSDWDAEICAVRPRLQLTLNCTKHRHRVHVEEFECTAYIDMEEGRSFLITQDRQTNSYSCWVIYTYPEMMSYKPWKEGYLLRRAQCGTDADRDPSTPRDYTLHIQAQDDKVQRPCSTYTEPPAPIIPSTPKTLQTKTARETEERREDGHKQYLGSSATHHPTGRALCLLWALLCLVMGRHTASHSLLPL